MVGAEVVEVGGGARVGGESGHGGEGGREVVEWDVRGRVASLRGVAVGWVVERAVEIDEAAAVCAVWCGLMGSDVKYRGSEQAPNLLSRRSTEQTTTETRLTRGGRYEVRRFRWINRAM